MDASRSHAGGLTVQAVRVNSASEIEGLPMLKLGYRVVCAVELAVPVGKVVAMLVEAIELGERWVCWYDRGTQQMRAQRADEPLGRV